MPGLNLPGMNLSLQPAGVVGRFIGRIGKKLRIMSYPRVAIDIEAAEAAAEAGEIEYVVAKQPPRQVLITERPRKHAHEYEEEEEAPPPRRRPPAQYYDYGPQPSPQNSYPPLPSVQRP